MNSHNEFDRRSKEHNLDLDWWKQLLIQHSRLHWWHAELTRCRRKLQSQHCANDHWRFLQWCCGTGRWCDDTAVAKLEDSCWSRSGNVLRCGLFRDSVQRRGGCCATTEGELESQFGYTWTTNYRIDNRSCSSLWCGIQVDSTSCSSRRFWQWLLLLHWSSHVSTKCQLLGIGIKFNDFISSETSKFACVVVEPSCCKCWCCNVCGCKSREAKMIDEWMIRYGKTNLLVDRLSWKD